LTVSLIVNNDKYLVRMLSDTIDISSIFLEDYNSDPIQTLGVQWLVNLLQLKLGHACDILLPEFNLDKQK
jgi:hypothetical protein